MNVSDFKMHIGSKHFQNAATFVKKAIVCREHTKKSLRVFLNTSHTCNSLIVDSGIPAVSIKRPISLTTRVTRQESTPNSLNKLARHNVKSS